MGTGSTSSPAARSMRESGRRERSTGGASTQSTTVSSAERGQVGGRAGEVGLTEVGSDVC